METWQILLLGYMATVGVVAYAFWNLPHCRAGREKWTQEQRDRGAP